MPRTVVGNPAVVRGLNLIGLKRKGVDPAGRQKVKRAHHILFREGLSTRQAVDKIRAELETGPMFIYREVGPSGGEYAAVNAFVRFSAHGWMP